MSFVKVCSAADIARGGALSFQGGPEPIAVFNVEGRFYATQDRCPHAHWPLSDSYVSGAVVECALHNARFCIRSGKRLSPPACRPLRTYAVKLEGGFVYVDIESGACEEREGAGAAVSELERLAGGGDALA